MPHLFMVVSSGGPTLWLVWVSANCLVCIILTTTMFLWEPSLVRLVPKRCLCLCEYIYHFCFFKKKIKSQTRLVGKTLKTSKLKKMLKQGLEESLRCLIIPILKAKVEYKKHKKRTNDPDSQPIIYYFINQWEMLNRSYIIAWRRE